MKRLIDEAYEKSRAIVSGNADRLLEHETIEGEEIRMILGLPEKWRVAV